MTKTQRTIGIMGSLILIFAIILCIYFEIRIENVKRYRTDNIFNNVATFIVDGIVYKRVPLKDGEIENMPDIPTKDSYVFDYWDLNGKKYNGGKLNNNRTLKAVFTKVKK